MHRMSNSEMVYNKIISFVETGYMFQMPLHLESKVTTMIYMRNHFQSAVWEQAANSVPSSELTDLRTERSRGVYDAAIQRRFQEVRRLFLAECPEGPPYLLWEALAVVCGHPN